LEEKITAGRTGQAQLGEYDNTRAVVLVGIACGLRQYLSVICRIGESDLGSNGSYFDKSVFHGNLRKNHILIDIISRYFCDCKTSHKKTQNITLRIDIHRVVCYNIINKLQEEG
jgi:hypothetical protein